MSMSFQLISLKSYQKCFFQWQISNERARRARSLMSWQTHDQRKAKPRRPRSRSKILKNKKPLELTRDRAAILFQYIETSRFRDFQISIFQDFKISIFQDFRISIFQDFEISIFQYFNILRFWDFEISRFQDFDILEFRDIEILSSSISPSP